MCGVAGILSLGGDPVAADEVTRMRETLVHRGPDGGETWVDDGGTVGLGFRRLSIIDLSPEAMQPMPNEDGSLQLVFNGEIYNHAEIRRELEKRGGHRWRTDHSDSEVIVHAFEEWGSDCLHRFRGMFALALWDARARELWLVRDRIGIKPLYYAFAGGRLAFASEIKALLVDPRLERAVDEESLYHYLSFLAVPPPRTLFRGIEKLPPATWLRVGADGRTESSRWWEPWGAAEPLAGASDEELADRLLDAIRTSVRYRKVSDVPVGVFLSGGLDSTTNAVLFSEGERQPVQTFAVGYDADYASYPDERGWARRAATFVGAEHHELVLSLDDVLAFLPEMVRLQDEPAADPVAVPFHFLSRRAREEGVIVAHAGEGADELLYGYRRWAAMLALERANRLPVPAALKRLGLRGLDLAGRGASWEREYLRRGAAGGPVFWGGAEAFTEPAKRRLLSPRLRAELDGLTSWDALEPIRARFDALAWEPSAFNWMSYVDLNLRLPELLLMRVDKMSMGASLEVRVPFLDHHLVELAYAMPSAAKTRGRELKPLLRRAVRGLFPEDLVRRPKQGFRMPVDEWFGERLGAHAREELARLCRETDLLDGGEVAKTLERPGRDAWYLLNLAHWWREWIA